MCNITLIMFTLKRKITTYQSRLIEAQAGLVGVDNEAGQGCQNLTEIGLDSNILQNQSVDRKLLSTQSISFRSLSIIEVEASLQANCTTYPTAMNPQQTIHTWVSNLMFVFTLARWRCIWQLFLQTKAFATCNNFSCFIHSNQSSTNS